MCCEVRHLVLKQLDDGHACMVHCTVEMQCVVVGTKTETNFKLLSGIHYREYAIYRDGKFMGWVDRQHNTLAVTFRPNMVC